MKKARFGQKIIFSRNYGGGVILSDGVEFGIKSLVSASGILHRVGAIKFQNFHFSANYHPPTPEGNNRRMIFLIDYRVQKSLPIFITSI